MQDFLAKTGKRNYRSTTVRIKESPEISIPDPKGERVEVCALNHFLDKGYSGVHSENYLWRGLFGLFFWEELFDSNSSGFHYPLQRMPSDLYSGFWDYRKESLLLKAGRFQSRKQLLVFIREHYSMKLGMNNPLVSWHDSLLPSIEAAISHLPLKGLKNVLLEMAKNVKDNSAGFPDLFIWKENRYHFYEIKSPNDHLSAQQLFWIEFLREQKINADILRLRYL